MNNLKPLGDALILMLLNEVLKGLTIFLIAPLLTFLIFGFDFSKFSIGGTYISMLLEGHIYSATEHNL